MEVESLSKAKQAPGSENTHKNKVHFVLAHSYTLFFILFLIGVSLDSIFPIKIFNASFMAPIGLIFLILATVLILWAQKTSRDLKKENISKETFCQGPYCYTRSPTHWGLFFLMLGFGLIGNALFVVLTTLISLVISRFVFLDKQENILAEKYGAPYLEYKKSVRF